MRVIIDFYIHRCLWCNSIQSTTQVKKKIKIVFVYSTLNCTRIGFFLLVLVHPCSFIHSFFLKLVPFTGTNFIFVCNSRTVASSVTSPVEGIAKTICILNSGVCAGGRYSSPLTHTLTHLELSTGYRRRHSRSWLSSNDKISSKSSFRCPRQVAVRVVRC